MRDQRDTDSRVIYIGPRAFIVIFAAFCGGFIIFLYGVGRFTTSLESEPIAVNIGAPVVAASSTPTVSPRPMASPAAMTVAASTAPLIPTTSPAAMAQATPVEATPRSSPRQLESTKLPATSVQASRSPAPTFAATPASRIALGEHAVGSGGAGATIARPRTNAAVKAPSAPAASASPCPPVTNKAPLQIAHVAHAAPISSPVPVTSTYLPLVTVPRAATAARAAAVQPATAVTSRPAPVPTPHHPARARSERKTVVAHAAPATPAALLVPFQNAGNPMSTHALDPRPGLLVSPNAPASGADGIKPRTR